MTKQTSKLRCAHVSKVDGSRVCRERFRVPSQSSSILTCNRRSFWRHFSEVVQHLQPSLFCVVSCKRIVPSVFFDCITSLKVQVNAASFVIETLLAKVGDSSIHISTSLSSRATFCKPCQARTTARAFHPSLVEGIIYITRRGTCFATCLS